VKSWDVIIVGAGIIGLSLAIELRKRGARVLIVERGEPGREASSAAAGMLAASGGEIPAALKPLAEESARMYPEFVHELEDELRLKVDLREQGTIVVSCDGHLPLGAEVLSPQRLRSLEPAIEMSEVYANSQLLPRAGRNGAPSTSDMGGRGRPPFHNQTQICAAYLPERSVDPRALVAAAIKAARHREVDISSGAEVKSLLVEGGRVSGVKTDTTTYAAEKVVNCAGAWAGTIAPYDLPVKPVKGQMLAVVEAPALKHVVRSKQVYLVPRSDRRLVIGSTLEEAGFNKQTDVNTLQRLFEAAVELVPGIARSRRHEAWAGLRPGTPDELPILGETAVSGFFAATGHYRDGILLAPITARVMADLLVDGSCGHDLAAFSPNRFMS
jgi:glycine/D-amino acid oxidase-like deaminating enzyme